MMDCSCNRENFSSEPAYDSDGFMQIKYCKFHPDAKAPVCMTNGAAGFDLTAVSCEQDADSGCLIYHTGIGIELPKGYVGRILCRSSIYKKDLRIISGVIDSDYVGEIRVVFDIKQNPERIIPSYYAIGDRIAQLVLYQHGRVDKWKLVPELKMTARGTGGFGSTGM